MGGNLPLGYDVKDRQLIINQPEGETVRYLFQRYAELKPVSALRAEAKRFGIVSKVWTSSSGKSRGGAVYSRGALYYLLRNPIYVGLIAHRGATYSGQHPAIVPQGLWDKVQTMLSENRAGGSRARTSSEPSLLSGLLYDDRGNRMSPSHARKADGKRYRYYVSQAVLQGRPESGGTVRRVSAYAIEAVVERAIADASLRSTAKEHAGDTRIRRLVKRITIHADRVEIVLTGEGCQLMPVAGSSGPLRIATVMKASRGGSKLVSFAPAARVDRSLVRALARARDLRWRLEHDTPLSELARGECCSRPYVSSLIRLAYLAPDITRAIVDGAQPAQLTLADLMTRDIPLDWVEQRRSFGFL